MYVLIIAIPLSFTFCYCYLINVNLDKYDKYYKKTLLKLGIIRFLFYKYRYSFDYIKKYNENKQKTIKNKEFSNYLSFRSFLLQIFNYLFTIFVIIIAILASINPILYGNLFTNVFIITLIYGAIEIIILLMVFALK